MVAQVLRKRLNLRFEESLLRQRRAGLTRLRDQAAVAENQGDLEARLE